MSQYGASYMRPAAGAASVQGELRLPYKDREVSVFVSELDRGRP